MNTKLSSIIRQLRTLMPLRALEEHEAKSIAERQAGLLLELLDQWEPAVDVGLIAELPRLDVGVAASLRAPTKKREEVSGYSRLNRGRWLIMVNSDDSRTRRRFTLSHEFKHVLDHPYMNVIYRNFGEGEDERKRKVEQLCDYFAACVLMPRNWLKQVWTSGIQNQTVLAEIFDVSEAAMAVRLQQIGLVESKPHYIRLRGLSHPVRSYFRRAPVTRQAVAVTA